MKISIKKYFTSALILLISLPVFSQTVAGDVKHGSAFPEWAMDPVFYILTFIFFVFLITIYVLYSVNVVLLKNYSPRVNESLTEKKRSDKKIRPSIIKNFYLKMVDSVPVEKEKDVLLDHDYDGIKELDNNLPPWWKYGFYFTIVFAVVYMFYYHVSGAGNLQLAEYQNELDLAAQQKAERMKAQANYVTEDNVVALTAAGDISEGKQVFMKLCAACHRADGGGQVGPNLTDEFWLHGGGIKNVFKTITYGVPNKGMLSWQSQLSPKQIQQISSYILTLKGSNPPAPKEQQGDKWEEPNIAASDSGKKNIVETSMLSIHDSIK